MSSDEQKQALIDRLELLTREFRAFHEEKEKITPGEDDLYKELEYKQLALHEAIDNSLANFTIGEDRPLVTLAEEVVVPEGFYHPFANHPVHAVEHDLGALIDYTFAPPPLEIAANKDRYEKQRILREITEDESPELFIFLSFTRFHTMPNIRLSDEFHSCDFCTFVILVVKRYLTRTADQRPPDWIFNKSIQLVIAKRADEPRVAEFRRAYHRLEFQTGAEEKGINSSATVYSETGTEQKK